MALVFSQCTDSARWNEFVSTSPQGTVFCHTAYLDSLEARPELYVVEENGRIVLGAVILKNEQGQGIPAPFAFSLYQGVLFADDDLEIPVHRRVGERLVLVDFLLQELEKTQKMISFCLHPTFPDIRSFSWFHYHQKELGNFQVHVRYTGLIDWRLYPDFTAYLNAIRSSRRRDYKKTSTLGLTVEASDDLDTLERLYRLTFERQDITLEEKTIKQLRKLAQQAIQSGIGEMLFCKNKEGQVISATLFLNDAKCSYYLIGANDPEFRNTGSGTYLMLENIKRAKERGKIFVDLIGINSPQRGDFKASFNASPAPYYLVHWQGKT